MLGLQNPPKQIRMVIVNLLQACDTLGVAVASPPEGRTHLLNYRQPRANRVKGADLYFNKLPLNLSHMTFKVAKGTVLFTCDPPATAAEEEEVLYD